MDFQTLLQDLMLKNTSTSDMSLTSNSTASNRVAAAATAHAPTNLNQQTRKIFNEICIYVTTLICLTGLIGNALSLKVFCSTKLPRTSSRVYLIALTISDGIFLVTHFLDTTCKEIVDLWKLDFPINITDQKQTMCRSFALLRYTCRAISPWIIVAFTLERFLVVMYPHHSSIISKPLLAKRFICFIIVLSVLISLYAPILSGVTQNPNMLMKRYPKKLGVSKTQQFTSSPLLYNYFQQKFYKRSCDVLSDYRSIYLYLTLFYTMIVIILPLIIVSVFNTILIARLYKSNDQWTSAKLELHEQELSYKELRDKKLQLENLKVTWTLIIISASFIFLTLPHVITYFLSNLLFLRNSIQSRSLYLIQKITELLYIFNHSINFFLYVVTRNSFRRVLKEKLKCDCFNLKSYMIINVNNLSIPCHATNPNQVSSSNNEPRTSLMKPKSDYHGAGKANIGNDSSNGKTNQPNTFENYWDDFNKDINSSIKVKKTKEGKMKKTNINSISKHNSSSNSTSNELNNKNQDSSLKLVMLKKK